MRIVYTALSGIKGLALGLFCLSTLPQNTFAAVDLTTNNIGTANQAIFSFTDQQPTGTGIISPFLRQQANGTEQGYNTSGGTPLDDKAGPWTHDIQLSDLAASTVLMNGVLYYKLLLDVNEPGGTKSLISLDRLEFYTSPLASQTTTNVGSLGALRYSLDGAGDTFVLLDASRNNGSGSGDMYAYIPVADFTEAAPTDYVYMFARFGDQAAANGSTEGGFEEWSIVQAAAPVPEPNVTTLIVISCGAFTLLRRRAPRH